MNSDTTRGHTAVLSRWIGLIALSLLLAACNQRPPDNKQAPKPAAQTPRGWDIPADPQEKAAYDYAHSLKLPDSVPKPVPFDFKEAERKAKTKDGKSVSDQYFEHLCKTEAGEYIFKTVENVEGVFQMRPRAQPGELDYDRYAPEEPTGLGYSNDVDDHRGYGVSEIYVQPMMGTYYFLERPKSGGSDGVLRYRRGLNESPPRGWQNGYSTGVPGKYGWGFTLPFMVVKEESVVRQSRYGYTWRGIKRARDREFSVGSGEYLVIDLETNEVLAVKRRFKISGRDKNRASHIWWGNARPCDTEFVKRVNLPREPVPIDLFVKKVLRPIPGLNDQYIPIEYKTVLEKEIVK